MVLTTFQQKVLQATKKIPKGKVSTYQQIAKNISNPQAARAVGNALNKNPFSPIVPCHRVVKSNGCVGGFYLGLKQKIKLLEDEGVEIVNKRVVKFNKIKFCKK